MLQSCTTCVPDTFAAAHLTLFVTCRPRRPLMPLSSPSFLNHQAQSNQPSLYGLVLTSRCRESSLQQHKAGGLLKHHKAGEVLRQLAANREVHRAAEPVRLGMMVPTGSQPMTKLQVYHIEYASLRQYSLFMPVSVSVAWVCACVCVTCGTDLVLGHCLSVCELNRCFRNGLAD